MRSLASLTLVAASSLVLSGCSREAETPTPAPTVAATAPAPPTATAPPAPAARTARATLAGLNGSAVTGDVTFTETAAGVSIEAHVNGLTPGRHGFHVHEMGDCSGDGTAAGDHFNPTAAAHGGPDGTVLHAGDFGNIEADASGHGMVTLVSRHVSLQEGATNSILGRAIIVHESADDLTTQPSGNSGARVACGVISLSDASGATGAMGATGTDAMGATGATGADAATGATGPAGTTTP